MNTIQIKRSQHRLLPDARRVLAKPFVPGEETLAPGPSRAKQLMDRILATPEAHVNDLNADILRRFDGRHRGFSEILKRHYELVAHHVPEGKRVTDALRLLIGAYFTHEFAVEAAALFNPSIVAAPDQSGVPTGSKRFVMSLRAVGEGHLSSIEFRSGLLDSEGNMTFDAASGHLIGGQRTSPRHFQKARFAAKLSELGAANELSAKVLGRLANDFTLLDLEASLTSLEDHGPPPAIWFETVKIVRMLASSNYITTFPADSDVAERVIFPAGPYETHGMEDARFVRFTEDDGSTKYYATYTAYDGFGILPQLIETPDFVQFTVSTLNGAAAQNKGMALFPRPIDGKYYMLSRRDRENLHLATSTDIHDWNDVTELYRAQNSWEMLQIGNCGSPIETPIGWVVLTHGVGPLRRYAIGALLLDLHDPRRVLGSLSQPFLEAGDDERDGYVPNVVYTCGAIEHAGQLIVPYGFSDSGIAVAQLRMSDLLDALVASPRPKDHQAHVAEN